MMNTLESQPELLKGGTKDIYMHHHQFFEHQNITCHTTSVENFKIINRKVQTMARAIKEAIYIRVNNPTLNRIIGNYNLPHIWDKVLFSISELKTN